MTNKTAISESQIVQGVLQLLQFLIPFTTFVLSPQQMQAAAGLSGAIAMFAWNQRRRQKRDLKLVTIKHVDLNGVETSKAIEMGASEYLEIMSKVKAVKK